MKIIAAAETKITPKITYKTIFDSPVESDFSLLGSKTKLELSSSSFVLSSNLVISGFSVSGSSFSISSIFGVSDSGIGSDSALCSKCRLRRRLQQCTYSAVRSLWNAEYQCNPRNHSFCLGDCRSYR